MSSLFLETDSLRQPLLDLYLIARFAGLPGEGSARGLAFERTIKEYQIENYRTAANGVGPFELPGASGLRHQVDVPMAVGDCLISSECKMYNGEMPKNELLVFNGASIDQYLDFVRQGGTRPFFRVFISGRPISARLRYFCYLWSIIAVDPQLVPIPVILGAVEKDVNHRLFQPPFAREAVRILGPAARALNELLRSTSSPVGSFTLDLTFAMAERNLSLIAEVHEFLSAEIVEGVEESDTPMYLEERASKVMSSLRTPNRVSDPFGGLPTKGPSS